MKGGKIVYRNFITEYLIIARYEGLFLSSKPFETQLLSYMALIQLEIETTYTI